MFEGRKSKLLQTIKDEIGNLTDSAKTYLSNLYDILVRSGDSGGFQVISDAEWEAFDEPMKEKDDHKIRVHYIISKIIEYKFITRSMTKKLKDWLLKNKEIVSGGALGGVIKQIVDYYFAHKDAIDNLVHTTVERLPHFPIIHGTEDTSDKPFYTISPERLFNDPAYIDEAHYLSDLSAIEIEVTYEGISRTVRIP
jgi:hypothetical protein